MYGRLERSTHDMSGSLRIGIQLFHPTRGRIKGKDRDLVRGARQIGAAARLANNHKAPAGIRGDSKRAIARRVRRADLAERSADRGDGKDVDHTVNVHFEKELASGIHGNVLSVGEDRSPARGLAACVDAEFGQRSIASIQGISEIARWMLDGNSLFCVCAEDLGLCEHSSGCPRINCEITHTMKAHATLDDEAVVEFKN